MVSFTHRHRVHQQCAGRAGIRRLATVIVAPRPARASRSDPASRAELVHAPPQCHATGRYPPRQPQLWQRAGAARRQPVARPGTIGLVGNNGAGKSTLLKVLLGCCARRGRRHDPGLRHSPRHAASCAAAWAICPRRPPSCRCSRGSSSSRSPAISMACRIATPAAGRTKCSTTSAWASCATAGSRSTRPAICNG